MALPLWNTCDVGTDESAVTTGNSGGDNGNAFNVVTITGGAVVYEKDKRRWGEGCIRCDLAASTVGSSIVGWNSTSIGTVTDSSFSVYAWISAAPSSNLTWLQFRGAAVNRCIIRMQASMIPQILNSASTVIYTAPSAVPTGKWFRVDVRNHWDAATGHVETQWFWDDTSSRTCDSIGTPSMTFGVYTDNQNLGGTLDALNIGPNAGTGQTGAASHWFDEPRMLAAATLPVGPPTELWQANGTWQPMRSAAIVTGAWEAA